MKRVQDNVTPEDEENLEQRILKTLSRLCGQELKNRGDLVRLTRSLPVKEAI